MSDVASLDESTNPPVRVEEAALGDAVMLQSAHLDGTRYSTGDTIDLLLIWRALQPLAKDYKVFVHVADESGSPVAQWDGLPGMNTARTSAWPVDESFRDHVFVRIPEDAPEGEYTLLAGMYDADTDHRLGGASVSIAKVTID